MNLQTEQVGKSSEMMNRTLNIRRFYHNYFNSQANRASEDIHVLKNLDHQYLKKEKRIHSNY